MPAICGGDFSTTTTEAAEEIATLARARFPHAEIRAIHQARDVPIYTNPFHDTHDPSADALRHLTRVEGFACSFDCLEAFAARWEPFTATVRGHFWRSLVRGD